MTGKMFTMAAFAALAAATPAVAQWNGGAVDTESLRAQIDSGVSRGDISSEDAASLRSQLRGLINLERQYEQDGLNAREREDLRQRTLGLRNEIAEAGGSAADQGRAYGNGYNGNTYGRYGANGYGNPAPAYGGSDNPAYNNRLYSAPYTNAPYANPSSNGGYYDNGRYGNSGYGNGQYDREDDADRDDTYRDDSDRNDGRYDRDDADRNDGRYDRDDQGYGDNDGGYALRVGERASGGLYGVPYAYRTRFRDGGGVYYRYGNGNVYQIDARTGVVLRIYSMGR